VAPGSGASEVLGMTEARLVGTLLTLSAMSAGGRRLADDLHLGARPAVG
jgi:hypothetical protein